MALCCYRCGKQIKGKAVHVVPPILWERLYGDFPKAYHPACHKRVEQEAGAELHPLSALRHHVSGAIERGEAIPVVEVK